MTPIIKTSAYKNYEYNVYCSPLCNSYIECLDTFADKINPSIRLKLLNEIINKHNNTTFEEKIPYSSKYVKDKEEYRIIIRKFMYIKGICKYTLCGRLFNLEISIRVEQR
jgi:hypothetical protein